MSENVKEINGERLQELLGEGKTVVCDFWAAWCSPCRMLAPVMDSLAAELGDRAEFVKIDIDAEGETAVRYGIMSIPAVFVLKGEEIVARNIGYVPESQMRTFLLEHLS